MVAEAQERYNVYFIVPGGASHGRDPRILDFWRAAIGEDRVIVLQSPEEISQCIALAIGLQEGTIDASKAVDDMQKAWHRRGTIDSIMNAAFAVMPGGKVDSDRNRRL